jgi:NitT/TauT family transport system substrate-binding protein
LIVLLTLTACRSNDTAPSPAPAESAPVKLRLALNWFAEPQHGGYFAALEAWRERGLEVEIVPGGPGVSAIARVAGGEVDAGIDNADIVALGRVQGTPVVAVMAPMQDSPRCIMVHRASGITSLRDLRNLTLAMSQVGAFPSLLQREAALEGVEIVPYPGTVTRFLVDGNYAQQAYSASEPVVARSRGADPICLPFSELGWNPYTSALLVNEKTLAERPEVVRALVEGALEGWRAYRADPTVGNDRIRAMNPELEPEIAAAMAVEVGKLVDGREGAALGSMKLARWTEVVAMLESLGLADTGAIDPNRCFDARFLAGETP